MDDCEFISRCCFFNDKMASNPQGVGMIKARYCHNSFVECARYRVMKGVGADKVPPDLYPYDEARASEILQGASVRTP